MLIRPFWQRLHCIHNHRSGQSVACGLAQTRSVQLSSTPKFDGPVANALRVGEALGFGDKRDDIHARVCRGGCDWRRLAGAPPPRASGEALRPTSPAPRLPPSFGCDLADTCGRLGRPGHRSGRPPPPPAPQLPPLGVTRHSVPRRAGGRLLLPSFPSPGLHLGRSSRGDRTPQIHCLPPPPPLYCTYQSAVNGIGGAPLPPSPTSATVGRDPHSGLLAGEGRGVPAQANQPPTVDG